MTELLLLLAGFAGGTLNTLAGGGSFIVFPALLAAGVPPVLANASNTYAALPGYISGFIGFWPSVKAHRGRLLVYSIISVIFGYLGAELLLRVSDDQFAYVVPWLLLFAVLLFAFGGRLNEMATRAGRGPGIGGLVLLAAICVYGGFWRRWCCSA
jgi:uncharacterized membrane protein YfcA